MNTNDNMYTWVKQHPAIIGSLLIFFISVIGTLNSWYLYSQFDINIFDFAEPNDFILAAFKDVYTFGFTLFTIIYFIIGFGLLRMKKKAPLNKLTISIMIFAIPSFIIAITLYGAYYSAQLIILDDNPNFNITLNDKSVIEDIEIIGSVDKFLFTYHYMDQKVSALTIKSITKIEKISDTK